MRFSRASERLRQKIEELQDREPSGREMYAWGVSIFITVTAALMAALALAVGLWQVAILPIVSMIAFGVLTWSITRYHHPIIRHAMMGTLNACILTTSLIFGGPDSPALFALPAVSALCVFLLGPRPGLVWTVFITLFAVVAWRFGWSAEWMDPTGLQALRFFVLASANVTVLAVTSSFMLVTQRQKAALAEARDRAEAALAQAQEADRAKSAFLAAMSHEIRTPLSAIIGCTELLREARPAEQGELLDTLSSSGTSLLGLIGEVLDFSRIEAGSVTVAVEPTEIRPLAREIAEVVRFRALSQGLTMTMEVRPEVPERALLDPGAIRQILINLLENAVRYTESGGIQLLVEVCGEELCWRVVDSGMGISAEEQERIFQPFRQVDEGHGRQHGGCGLGLAISAGLAHAHSGVLRVDSEPGVGSTFTLRLPLSPCAAQTDRSASHDLPLDLPILLVEDHPINQMILRRTLEGLGCRVQVAGGGAEALTYLSTARVALVFMDLQMPGMDGFETTRLLRQEGHRVPIVALSANTFTEDRLAAIAAGMNAFLSKPASAEQLRAVLEEHSVPPAPEQRALPAPAEH